MPPKNSIVIKKNTNTKSNNTIKFKKPTANSRKNKGTSGNTPPKTTNKTTTAKSRKNKTSSGNIPNKINKKNNRNNNNNSTNNPWLVFLTWGESLHNNHHYRPRRLNFNTKWYELDVGRWLISTIKKS